MKDIGDIIDFPDSIDSERRKWGRASTNLMNRIAKVGSKQAFIEEYRKPQLDDPDWLRGIKAFVNDEEPPRIQMPFEDVTYSCHVCKDVMYVSAPDVIRNGIEYTRMEKCSGGDCPAWRRWKESHRKQGPTEDERPIL